MKRYKQLEPMIDHYLKGEAIYTFISDELIDLVNISYLLGEEEKYFINSMEPQKIRPGSNIMLTTTSIVFLYKYNLLDKINKYFDVYVLRSTVINVQKTIRKHKNKINTRKKKIKNGIDKDKNIMMLKEELDILSNIHLKLKNLFVIDIHNNAKNEIISAVVPKHDVEVAEYAMKFDMYIVIDDLGTTGLINTFIGNKKIVNTASLLNSIIFAVDSKDGYFNVLNNMIKDKYLFAISFNDLCTIISFSIENNYKDELELTLRNMIKYDYNNYYRNILDTYLEVSPNCRYIEKKLIKRILEQN